MPKFKAPLDIEQEFENLKPAAQAIFAQLVEDEKNVPLIMTAQAMIRATEAFVDAVADFQKSVPGAETQAREALAKLKSIVSDTQKNQH